MASQAPRTLPAPRVARRGKVVLVRLFAYLGMTISPRFLKAGQPPKKESTNTQLLLLLIPPQLCNVSIVSMLSLLHLALGSSSAAALSSLANTSRQPLAAGEQLATLNLSLCSLSLSFLYLSTYLPTYLPICLSIYRYLSLFIPIYPHLSPSTSIYRYIYIYIYLYLSTVSTPPFSPILFKFISLSLSLSFCLCLSLSVPFSVSVSVSLPLSLSLSVSLYFSPLLSMSISLFLSLFLSFALSSFPVLSLPVLSFPFLSFPFFHSFFVFLSFCRSFFSSLFFPSLIISLVISSCLSVCVSGWLAGCLAVCLSVRPSVCLSLSLSLSLSPSLSLLSLSLSLRSLTTHSVLFFFYSALFRLQSAKFQAGGQKWTARLIRLELSVSAPHLNTGLSRPSTVRAARTKPQGRLTLGFQAVLMHPLGNSALHNLTKLAAVLTLNPHATSQQVVAGVDPHAQIERRFIYLPMAASLVHKLLQLQLTTPPGDLLPALPAPKMTPLEVPSVSLLAFCQQAGVFHQIFHLLLRGLFCKAAAGCILLLCNLGKSCTSFDLSVAKVAFHSIVVLLPFVCSLLMWAQRQLPEHLNPASLRAIFFTCLLLVCTGSSCPFM